MGPDLRLAAAALSRLGKTVMLLYEKLSCGTAVCLTTAARFACFRHVHEYFPVAELQAVAHSAAQMICESVCLLTAYAETLRYGTIDAARYAESQREILE